jgi:hypothetical protein
MTELITSNEMWLVRLLPSRILFPDMQQKHLLEPVFEHLNVKPAEGERFKKRQKKRFFEKFKNP